MERLNAIFDVTNWDVFVDNAKDVSELVDTISEYIKFNVDMLVPKKTVKQYNKPWISSELRRQIVNKHKAFTKEPEDCNNKQSEVDNAIKKAKNEYKFEQLFHNNKMKDAWNGLDIITGRKTTKKACNLTSTPGSADRLNNFYARFSAIHQRIKTELLNELSNETPITISESEV